MNREIKNLGKRKLKVIFKISLTYRKFIITKVSALRLSFESGKSTSKLLYRFFFSLEPRYFLFCQPNDQRNQHRRRTVFTLKYRETMMALSLTSVQNKLKTYQYFLTALLLTYILANNWLVITITG